MAVQITESPESSLVGLKYETLAEALQTMNGLNLSAQSSITTIKILEDIPDEQNDIINKNIKIDLNGHTVSSSSGTTTLTVNDGSLTIIDSVGGGKIINQTMTALEIGETGSLTLGENDKTVSQTSPEIEGISYGIDTLGIFNYYDGKVIGEIAINGEISNIPSLRSLEVSTESGIQITKLVEVLNPEAKIGEKGFASLETAIDYANQYTGVNGEQVEIKVVKDLTKSDSIQIGTTKNIKLNLNGHTVDVDSIITNKGNLEIVDTSQGALGRVSSDTVNPIESEGNLKVSSGAISAQNSRAITNRRKGTIEIAGGTITSNAEGITNLGTGSITISGGNISANIGIYTNTKGAIEVTGGNVTGTNTGIRNNNTGLVTINGGTVSGGLQGIYNDTTGKVTINDGTVKGTNIGSYGVYNNNYGCIDDFGTITVTGGNILGNQSSIYNYKGDNQNNAGKVEITGGNITGLIYNDDTGVTNIDNAVATDIDNYGELTINNSETKEIINSGTMQITGGTINGISDNTSAITNSGTITIESSTITSAKNTAIKNEKNGNITIENTGVSGNNNGITNEGIMLIDTGDISSNDSYGIWNSGVITLGAKDGQLNNQTPEVSGGYGVYNTGIFNFYDGKIIGSINQSIRGDITQNESNYYLQITTNSNSTETATLGARKAIAKINGTTYTNLQSAVNASNEGDIIEYLENAVINEQTSIPAGKNVIMDLNGHDIKQYEKIINNGLLTIKDSSSQKTGVLNQNTTKTIQNKAGANLIMQSGLIKANIGVSITNEANATFTMTEGEITGALRGTDANNYADLIVNKGNMIINGGKINTIGQWANNIYNTGRVEMTDGRLNATGENSRTIYIAERGEMETTGGIILIPGGTTKYGIYNDGLGKVQISGLTLSTAGGGSTIGIYNNSSGTILFQDGSITGTTTGIVNNGLGKVEISGGTITENIGVVNNAAGELVMSNGRINATNTGIFNKGTGTIRLTGGTIKITEGNSYGINNQQGGLLIMGVKDSNVSIEYPAIMAMSYGVYNKGTFNFYDGIITGASNQSIYGTVSDKETGYTVRKETVEDNKESATLQK